MRGIASLTAASAISRAVSAGSVLLLALWLTPEDFGLWASASSATAIVLAFVNLGEVNGYLSGNGSGFRAAQRATLRSNTVLTAVALLVAGAYAIAGLGEVAMLCVWIALSIMAIGQADLLYAVGVKHDRQLRVAVSQVVGAVTKVVTGVALASILGSALAIAVSTVLYYVVICSILSPLRQVASGTRDTDVRVSGASRITWAMNSIFLILPVQAAFLVAQFLAPTDVLGIFYLAFQATLAVTGIVSVPIARSSLTLLQRAERKARTATARRIVFPLVGALTFAIALSGVMAPWIAPHLGADWRAAIPAVLLLAASIPMRIATPVLDSLQQASNHWWRSTAFNALDALLSALAASLAVFSDAVILALAIAVAKILVAATRMLVLLRGEARGVNILLLVGVSVLGAAALVVQSLTVGTNVALGSTVIALVCGGWLFVIARRRA